MHETVSYSPIWGQNDSQIERIQFVFSPLSANCRVNSLKTHYSHFRFLCTSRRHIYLFYLYEIYLTGHWKIALILGEWFVNEPPILEWVSRREWDKAFSVPKRIFQLGTKVHGALTAIEIHERIPDAYPREMYIFSTLKNSWTLARNTDAIDLHNSALIKSNAIE